MGGKAASEVVTVDRILTPNAVDEIQELEEVNDALARIPAAEVPLVEAWVKDFAVELILAYAQMREGVAQSGKKQSSISVTTALVRHPGSRKKSGYLEGKLEARVRTPRAARYYAIDETPQGVFEYGGEKDGPGRQED